MRRIWGGAVAVRTEQHEAFPRQMSPPHLGTGEAGGAMGVYPWVRRKPSSRTSGAWPTLSAPSSSRASNPGPGGANYASTYSAEDTWERRWPKPKNNAPAGAAQVPLCSHAHPPPLPPGPRMPLRSPHPRPHPRA